MSMMMKKKNKFDSPFTKRRRRRIKNNFFSAFTPEIRKELSHMHTKTPNLNTSTQSH